MTNRSLDFLDRLLDEKRARLHEESSRWNDSVIHQEAVRLYGPRYTKAQRDKVINSIADAMNAMNG